MSKLLNQVKKDIGMPEGHSFILFGIASMLIVVLLLGFSGRQSSLVKKPNIVIIFADDMGYGDIQSLNPMSRIKTPAIDELVNSGIS